MVAELYFPPFKLISHDLPSIQLLNVHIRKELELSRSGLNLWLGIDFTLIPNTD